MIARAPDSTLPGVARAAQRAQTPIGDPDDDDWEDDDDLDDDEDDDDEDDEEPMQLARVTRSAEGGPRAAGSTPHSVWASLAETAPFGALSDKRIRSGRRSTCSLSIIRAL